GQIYGGALHGLGGALYEEMRYDDDGQFLTGSFMDYLVPTASEAPTIEIAHLSSPSPLTTLGSKGLGESSSMTVPAVIANAVSDLNRIPALAYIKEVDGSLRFGAMTRQRAIEFSPVVARRLPLLTEATRWVGHLPIRTRGTIGGSIAHADPSAEYPAVLTALDGEVVAR